LEHDKKKKKPKKMQSMVSNQTHPLCDKEMCGNVKEKPSKLPNAFPYFWELEVLGCLKSLNQGFGRMQIGPSFKPFKMP
jgi:hypothetical protein